MKKSISPLLLHLFFLISFICFLVFASYSQTREEIKQMDEIQKKIRISYRDTSKRSEIEKLHSDYINIISKSKSFVAFTVGYEINKSNIDGLNSDLQSIGFAPIKNKMGAIVFGYSRMNKRVTGNLLFNVVPGNKTFNNEYEISLRGAGATFDKGYAFVYTDKIIIHAFAGIGWQYHTVKEKEKISMPTGNILFPLLPGASTGKITQDLYHGSLGVQFDLNTTYKKTTNFGLQTAIRFSYNPIIAKSKYHYGENESQYKPIINWRQYNISVLLKLFSKTYFRR